MQLRGLRTDCLHDLYLTCKLLWRESASKTNQIEAALLCCTGIDGFSNVNRTHIEAALPVLTRNGAPYLVHAEIVGDDDTEPQVISACSTVLAHSIMRGYHAAVIWLVLPWCHVGVYYVYAAYVECACLTQVNIVCTYHVCVMSLCNVYTVIKAQYVIVTPSAVHAAWSTNFKIILGLLTAC